MYKINVERTRWITSSHAAEARKLNVTVVYENQSVRGHY